MELIGKPQNIGIALDVEASDPRARVFVVTVQNLAPLISRMSYEKSDKDVKLYFTLKSARTPETLLRERILAKMERNQEKKLCVSTLTRQDFEQTGANSKMLPHAIEKVRSLSDSGFSYGVTFEEAGGKRGLLWARNPSLIQEYKQTYQGIQKGNWLLWNA